ncbi:DUF305 domain-containing protein [Microbacterium sp. NPDC056569]|uniref:DUF305 domain-containing protein n=1 Tax=Microbacterium sp. NPDC056569 TaxID=3345867 RepID=UPI00366D7BDE
MTTAGRFAGAAAAVVLVLGLTACTATEEEPLRLATAPVVQPGAPGEPNRTLSPEEAAQLTGAGYVEADVLFVRDMLHHHSQALQMTGYVPDRTGNRDILLLAERMDVSQTDEIALLEKWLQDRGEPVRDPDESHGAHAAEMPGLLTDAQLAQLEAARDDEFDRLFLEFMIIHHSGAVEMVGDLYQAGGGLETELDIMASHIEADQNIEIERMRGLLGD